MSNFDLNVDNIYKAYDRTATNYQIGEYYTQMFIDSGDDIYRNKAFNIANCYKYFTVDYYREQKIKDIKNISLCHDKFCKNCQNLISKQRYFKFKPYLDECAEKQDIYHVVLTVPSVHGYQLAITISRMYVCFQKFIKYFRRKGKNSFDFGYTGAIRSLEITTKNGDYHPHFHCLFALGNNLDITERKVNKYSYDNGCFRRAFTDIEIAIQKLWYLIWNEESCSQKHVSELKEGYSCICQPTNGDYKEVFKYTLKESFDSIAESQEVFNVLYEALKGRRVIQGYGIFFGLNSMDEDIKFEADVSYILYIAELMKVEDPIRMQQKINDLISDCDNTDISFVSRNSIREVIDDEE